MRGALSSPDVQGLCRELCRFSGKEINSGERGVNTTEAFLRGLSLTRKQKLQSGQGQRSGGAAV